LPAKSPCIFGETKATAKENPLGAKLNHLKMPLRDIKSA